MRNTTRIVALVCATVAVCGTAPFVGIEWISVGDLSDPALREIFYTMRIPRVLTAFLAGGGLGLCGMVFQSVFRNPLATPFTLGVAAGASCGASAAILFGVGAAVIGIPLVSIGAFAGAILAMFLVFGFSVLKRDTSGPTMLLAGIAVSFFFSSLLMFLQYLSDLTHSFQIVRWLMGGIEVFGYDHFAVLAPLEAVGTALLLWHLPHLDQFLSGEDIARSRGVDVLRTRFVLLGATTITVAGIVAVCGPIGFVGMMAPHMCRLIFGSSHRTLGPTTFVFGGTFLVVCDTFARTIVAPSEMPVGVVTALLGGPFFLWLLFGRRNEGLFF